MPPRIPDNTRVKLRDGISPEAYEGFGLAGNEGWVRKHQSDRYGPEQVFIQWDKDHWAYNGAQDKWTWEDHFDIVEEPMTDQTPTRSEQLTDLMGAFTASLLEIVGDDSPAPPQADVPPAPEAGQEQPPSYGDILKSAIKASADAESFFVIAIRKDDNEGVIYPLVYHASQTPEASLIAQLQLSHVASSFHAKLVGEALQAVSEPDEDESGD